jgi:GABA(A) receptor-associated protein
MSTNIDTVGTDTVGTVGTDTNTTDNINTVGTVDLNMITLQQSNIKKQSKIDFTKTTFTDEEKTIIRKEVDLIKEKYPTYIPIVVRARGDIKLQKNKFLVGGEITLGQFLMILRRKIGVLKQSDAVFLFVNNSLPPSSMYLSSIYANQKDIDTNMLFITVSKENTFG